MHFASAGSGTVLSVPTVSCNRDPSPASLLHVWDVKSCGLLCCWSRGRTDPPAVEGAARHLVSARRESILSHLHPRMKGMYRPHSSQSLPALLGPPGFPGALRGPWRPGSSPEGCDLDPCPLRASEPPLGFAVVGTLCCSMSSSNCCFLTCI